MKRLYFLLLLIVLQNFAISQETGIELRKEPLYNPLFYSAVPKFFSINGHFRPKFDMDMEETGDTKIQHGNEFIGSVNAIIPVVNNKGWYASGLLSYNSFTYRIDNNDKVEFKNKFLYSFGIWAGKKFNLFNKSWYWSHNVNFEGVDFKRLKNINYISTLSTDFTFANDDVMLIGLIGIYDRNVPILFLPFLNYSTWISKQNAILFTIQLPTIEVSATKIFSNRTMLKAGVVSQNHRFFINSSDYPLPEQADDYQLRRIQLAPNIKYEKAFYKDFWFYIETGYALNTNSAIYRRRNDFITDNKTTPNSAYLNIGFFIRPTDITPKK